MANRDKFNLDIEFIFHFDSHYFYDFWMTNCKSVRSWVQNAIQLSKDLLIHYLFIYSLTQQIYIEHLLYNRYFDSYQWTEMKTVASALEELSTQ